MHMYVYPYFHMYICINTYAMYVHECLQHTFQSTQIMSAFISFCLSRYAEPPLAK